MPDNLTLQLKQELARRGKIVTDAQVENYLNTQSPPSPPTQQQTQQPNQSLWGSLGQESLPDWYESDTQSVADNSPSNALAAGLWSFADTALFGIPGLFVDEEDYIDFEDPLAKWIGAIAGFGGFAMGAPMRVGAKVATGLASKIIPKVMPTKSAASTIIKGMKEAGKSGGLSNKAIKQTTSGYRSLVQKAQIDKTLQGEKFGQAVSKYRDEYIQNAVNQGILKNADEANAVRSMFTENVFKRPLQDFKGLALARYGDTKYAKWLGHAVNDVVMFSFIDGVFEGVNTIEDHEYDYTAPLWGAANGLAFSSLSLLNPKGKSASWFKDFKIGIKSVYSRKSPYAKMNENQLASVSRYIGSALKNNGAAELGNVPVTYGGVTKNINLLSMGDSVGAELGSSRTLAEFKEAFGGNAEKAMRGFLEKERKKWGREIIKWSSKEEAVNLMQVWPRMVAGGALFNAHSFYDMFAHDQEFDFVNDILPHFLIGAYLQRHSNPAKFDLNAPQMTRVRENLAILGFKPDQLTQIPSLHQPESPLRNPLHSDKYKKVIEVAESEGAISDNFESMEKPLSEREKSVGLPQNKNADFEQIYGWLNGMRAYQKPFDGISTKSAEKIVEEWKKANPDVDLKSVNSVEKMLDTESLKMTEEFENNFSSIIGSLKNSEANNELKIITETNERDNTSTLKVPEHVMISEEIIKLARDGKLDFLESEGQEAVNKLNRAFDGLNSITYMSGQLGQIKINPSTENNTLTIKEIQSAKDIYERITLEEKNVNNLFPNKSSMATDFGFASNLNDYRMLLLKNHAIRTAQGVTDIFKTEFRDRDPLIKYLKDSGLIEFRVGTTDPLLINSIDQINLKDTGFPEKDAERKRFLGRVLSIQSITGKYKRTDSTIEIDGSKIDVLQNKLSEYGYNESQMPMWMHKHIIDFAIREKIEGTKLSLAEVDSIMSLSGIGMATMGVDVTGKKASGFRVRLIDELVMNEGQELVHGLSSADIIEYNTKIRDIVKKSDGLIDIEADAARVTDMSMLKIMVDTVKPAFESGDFTSARSTLMDFLTLIGTSDKPGSEKFQNQLGRFIEEGGPESEARALKWLNEFNLINLKEGERKFEVDLKNFNELVAQRIGERIDRFGVTPEYAESIYATLEKNARDREMLDSGEGDYEKNITMQEFFTRYRVDNKQETLPEHQDAIMEGLIFEAWDFDISKWENRKPRTEVIDKILERLYVQNSGKTDWHPFSEETTYRKTKIKPILIRDLVSLIGGRKNQASKDKIEWKNGRIVKSKEVKQKTRMDTLFDKLGIDYVIIDPFINTYVISEDRGRVEKKRVDIFGSTNNLSGRILGVINTLKSEFDAQLGIAREIDGQPIVGANGEIGMTAVRIAPNTNPIGIRNSDLPKLKAKFDSFAELYLSESSPLGTGPKNSIKDIKKSLDFAEENNRLAPIDDYRAALRRIYLEDMLVGSDGDRLFTDFLNGKIEIDKLFGRAKLYDTKKFVKFDSEFIIDVADSYKAIGDKETDRVLKERVKRNGWGVAIWNDKLRANVKEEVRALIESENIDFDLDSVLGEAHKDVSSFDSIAYVNKNTMKFYHTMIGHNPESSNPIKPVISSGGGESPLLMGKTLFIYSPQLEGFFGNPKNKNVDILLTHSGAKAFNPLEAKDGSDRTLINDADWSDLNTYSLPRQSETVRNLSLNSIGVKPEKDVIISTGKKSPADMNYADNAESASYFKDEISGPLNRSISDMQKIIREPISTRKWILDTFGDDALISMVDGKESLNHLNGMSYFAGLSRDANPMSYNESMVKNKIYGSYIDPLINNKRSVTNQFDSENSERYGGQASLIQAPMALSHEKARLRPTLVDKDGVKKSNGEVVLPNYEGDMKVSSLISKGYQIRLVENDKVYDMGGEKGKGGEVKEIIDALGGKGQYENILNNDWSLREIHEFIEILASENKRPNLQVGILVRRNPRTRPNDMALMGLKGFLDPEYGNSMMINSLDVVNVFEGDYDADKADYFFAERNNMYEHVKRTSQFFVQGVDPTRFIKKSGFSFGLNSTRENEAVEKMSADLDLYKRSIGLVQKVPRMLNYLGNLAADVTLDSKGFSKDKRMEAHKDSKILYDGNGYKIVMDYDNKDFYQRAALETQYIIDGSGELNQNIANDIFSWRDRFLFPTIEESINPREMKSRGAMGFAQEVSRKGHSDNQRVRIFKRLNLIEGEYVETDNLSRLDKAIVKEMLSEYGKFLGVTGNTAYEKSGEQRKVTYEDVMEGSDRFFNFNNELRKSLYYRLRNRFQDPNAKKPENWYKSPEFISLFGVKTNKKGDNVWFTSENDKMFMNTVTTHSKEFSEGRRGSPIERTLWKLHDANIFEQTKVETLTGDVKRYMDDWYNEYVSDPRTTNQELSESSARLSENVLKTAFDINRRVSLIQSLNKKIMQIKYGKQTWAKKELAIEKLNNLKGEVELEIKDWLSKEYKISKSSKDLQKIKFVDVNSPNMKKGTIYYSTLEQIKRFMPLIGGEDSFGLSDKGIEDIKTIKKYRKLFYGSQENLGEIIKYGGKSMLSPEQLTLLDRFPDMNTYYDIESDLLLRGANEHGLKFIWSFMQPSLNKYNIGIFEGKPLAVPFEAKEGFDPSSRYRRGINFLTQIAMGNKSFGEQTIDPDVSNVANQALRYLQMTEAQFERFFERKFHLKNLVSENYGDVFSFGDEANKKLVYDAIRLPNFHTDFEKRFGDFGTIEWTKTSDRAKNGFGLFNDHLFSFYRDIMKAAGKEGEFDTYIEQMSELENLMMGNNVINPLRYMHSRNAMDKDIRDIAQTVLSSALKQGALRPELTSQLMNNPVYALMGGNSFWKGLTLERQAKYSMDGLKNMKEMSNTVEKVRLRMPIEEGSEQRHRKLIDDMIELKKC